MTNVRALLRSLNGDARRISRPFNEDVLQANALLHNPAATEHEMAECASLWCQRRQGCQFGMAAASQGRIHFCFLRDESVSEWSDQEIAQKIREEKQLWKQRAAFDPRRAAHSFVIVVASPRVALAAPDRNLRAFADRILALAEWAPDRRGARSQNAVTSDYLYLRNPVDSEFYGFRFNIDFFACAGDGRWWQDHRFPGGIAFTANSTGHMMRYRDWYLGKDDNEAWGLKQAMFTIQNAAPTAATHLSDPKEQGRVVWLRSLEAGDRPMLQQIACPLAKVPAALAGKDWTRYEGLLHTDHAVREEFFLDRETAPTAMRPYLMDLTYLYDLGQADFEDFSGGRLFSQGHVYREIGQPEEWRYREIGTSIGGRTDEQAQIVGEQLRACHNWESSVSDGGNNE